MTEGKKEREGKDGGGVRIKKKRKIDLKLFSLSLFFSLCLCLSLSSSLSTLTQILVRVVKVGVADRRDDAGLGAPVHADLLEPLKVRGVADALADELLCFFSRVFSFEFFFLVSSRSERTNEIKKKEKGKISYPSPPSGACGP